MTSMPWDAQGGAQAALRAIVADPRYGPAALSNAQTMTNLLKDMLPDAPRESSEFYVQSPDHAGPGGAVGILGGLLLLAAGLIAAASRPASAAVAGGP